MKNREHFIIALTLALCMLCTRPSFSQKHIIVKNEVGKLSQTALLILPGFGNNKKNRKAQVAFFAHKGYDLFIPDFHDRKGYKGTVENLAAFMQSDALEPYDSIYVFSYILGSWVLNDYLKKTPDPRIKKIVYDRSPIQERAPYVVARKIPILAKMAKGRVVIEFKDIAYSRIDTTDLKVGIIVENAATFLMRAYKKVAMSLGAVHFESRQFDQDSHDLIYTWLNHDQMYRRFDVIGEDILHFFAHSSFTVKAKREPLDLDPWKKVKKKKSNSERQAEGVKEILVQVK